MTQITYKVKIMYVDYTYYDEGSRWTFTEFKFKDLNSVILFCHNILQDGCILEGQCGSKRFFIDKRDISLIKEEISDVDIDSVVWQCK